VYAPTWLNEPPRTIVEPLLTTASTVPSTTIDVCGRFEIADALPASAPKAIAHAAAAASPSPSGGWNLVPTRRRNGMPAKCRPDMWTRSHRALRLLPRCGESWTGHSLHSPKVQRCLQASLAPPLRVSLDALLRPTLLHKGVCCR